MPPEILHVGQDHIFIQLSTRAKVWSLLEKDDAVFYALLKMGRQCPQALTPHPNPLSKKIGSVWLVEVEHGHNDLGKHENYTFWYKIMDDPKKAEWGCRQGLSG